MNPETGERRRRVGFLFKTAPHPVLPDFLTDDDRWKLDGCSYQRRADRAERVAGLVCLSFFWSILCDSLCQCDGCMMRLCFAGRWGDIGAY